MRTRWVVVCLVVVVACQGDRVDRGSTPKEIGVLTGVPIDRMLPNLDSEEQDLIRFAMGAVPKPLPETATPFVQYLEGAKHTDDGSTLQVPPNDRIHAHYDVAAPGTNSLAFNFICLRNFEQVRCSAVAKVWKVDLSPKTIVRVPVELDARDGDRLDFLIMIDGDDVRPFPASEDSHDAVGHVRRQSSGTGAEHEAVLGGCDFATITTETSFQTNFQPPRRQSTSRQLYLLVQPACHSGGSVESEVVLAAEIIDRVTVLPLPGLDSPTRTVGRALIVPIPRSPAFKVGSQLQIVVFRERLPGWMTQGVRFVA